MHSWIFRRRAEFGTRCRAVSYSFMVRLEPILTRCASGSIGYAQIVDTDLALVARKFAAAARGWTALTAVVVHAQEMSKRHGRTWTTVGAEGLHQAGDVVGVR